MTVPGRCRCFTIILSLSRTTGKESRAQWIFQKRFSRLMDYSVTADYTVQLTITNAYNLIQKKSFSMSNTSTIAWFFFYLRQDRYQTTTTNLLDGANSSSLSSSFSFPLHKGIFLLPTNVNFICCSLVWSKRTTCNLRHNWRIQLFKITRCFKWNFRRFYYNNDW